MKLCAVQYKPVKGNIEKNIERHLSLLETIVFHGADIVIFPELSLTGYEPSLAKSLATTPGDKRLDVFQAFSDKHRITIGVGIPANNDTGIFITMIVFQPGSSRETYCKQYLHADEEPFFVSGRGSIDFLAGKQIALSICYELSVPAHAAHAHEQGASIYLSSVAKTATGMEKAIKSLSETAVKYDMTILLSNCVGMADGELCGGKSFAMSPGGKILAQLDDSSEGIIVLDTNTMEAKTYLF